MRKSIWYATMGINGWEMERGEVYKAFVKSIPLSEKLEITIQNPGNISLEELSKDELAIVFRSDGSTELVFPNYSDEELVLDHMLFACKIYEMIQTMDREQMMHEFCKKIDDEDADNA